MIRIIAGAVESLRHASGSGTFQAISAWHHYDSSRPAVGFVFPVPLLLGVRACVIALPSIISRPNFALNRPSGVERTGTDKEDGR